MYGDLDHSQNDELNFTSGTRFVKIRVKDSGKGVIRTWIRVEWIDRKGFVP